MARLWQRLQSSPESAGRSSVFHTEKLPTAQADTLPPNKAPTEFLPFIEVGGGAPIDSSPDVAELRRQSKKTIPLDRPESNAIKTKPAWAWPSELDDAPEAAVVPAVLEMIARRLQGSACVVILATNTVPDSVLARLLLQTARISSKEGCGTLILPSALPLPAGLPTGPGVSDYLAGHAELADIVHVGGSKFVNVLPRGHAAGAQTMSLQARTYLGLLRRIRRDHELILAGARQNGPPAEVATLLGFADGVFITATEGEDAQVERWQHALAQQGATYLGWIQVRDPINAPASDGSWRSPNVQRMAG